jgi:geranylgeranyl diphosphate synthase type II
MNTDIEQQNRMTKEQFQAQLADMAAQAGRMLDELLQKQPAVPARLKDAMEYMLQSGGKRIRSALVMWTCEMTAGEVNRDAQIAAAAVEMVHTYSLIHDDLPAMDDDDMRRGRPSCHKQFDEATAILAGDALLTLAFEVLATEVGNPAAAISMIRTLAKAAGPAGMIAGQIADMEGSRAEANMESLEYIHTNKTAEMFAASAVLGGIAGGASDSQLANLREYGMKIGLGFQIADDLLDVTSNAENLGKTAGKDTVQGKLTYPALVGIEKSREIFERITFEAAKALITFGPRADMLRMLATELLRRTR